MNTLGTKKNKKSLPALHPPPAPQVCFSFPSNFFVCPHLVSPTYMPTHLFIYLPTHVPMSSTEDISFYQVIISPHPSTFYLKAIEIGTYQTPPAWLHLPP